MSLYVYHCKMSLKAIQDKVALNTGNGKMPFHAIQGTMSLHVDHKECLFIQTMEKCHFL